MITEVAMSGRVFDNRDLVGANDMKDGRLGEERLHKPAVVEEFRAVPAVENVQHHEQRQVIEDRSGRAEKQNKAQDLANRSLARLAQSGQFRSAAGDTGAEGGAQTCDELSHRCVPFGADSSSLDLSDYSTPWGLRMEILD
jgi:hypothetical protein